MKLYKFSKLAGFLSVAIIGSSLLTLGCSKEDPKQEYDKCIVTFAQKNLSETSKVCKNLADQGNTEAQFFLDIAYQNGFGEKQKYFKSIDWYQKEAEQGNASAAYCLGGMFANGYGVKQDFEEAARWYIKAADLRHPRALILEGMYYATGKYLKQDYSKAIESYKLSCDLGLLDGCKRYKELTEALNKYK